MAFTDFRSPEGTAASSQVLIAPAWDQTVSVAAAEDITPFEWRVVELAKNDERGTLLPLRKRGWFARLILGPQPPSRQLANEKLEALRRLAVHAWHDGYLLPVSAIKDAMQAGYTEMQAGRVIDTVVETRLALKGLH
jgi:hypothetical protein